MTSRRQRPSADKGLVRGAGSRRESRAFALGTLSFGALLWLAGAAPWSLPAVCVAFSAVALPYRAIEFGTGRNAFFLLDFCYVRRACFSMDPFDPFHFLTTSIRPKVAISCHSYMSVVALGLLAT